MSDSHLVVYGRPCSNLAGSKPLERRVGHIHLGRGVHDGAVSDVPEHRYDPRDYARHRFANAIYLLWRVEFDRVLRHVWACAECVYAADALTRYSGFSTCGQVN